MNMPTEPQQDRNVEACASELLPCPFCGRRAAVLPTDDGEYRAYCWDWEACPVGPSVSYETKDQAIAAWNSRPSQPPQNVEAGDAVKGVVEEIDNFARRYDELVGHCNPANIFEALELDAEIREWFRKNANRLRLALSASGKRYPDDPME